MNVQRILGMIIMVLIMFSIILIGVLIAQDDKPDSIKVEVNKPAGEFEDVLFTFPDLPGKQFSCDLSIHPDDGKRDTAKCEQVAG